MRHVVVDREGFVWIDAVTSTREELETFATEFDVPPTVVEDTLDPEHLPKFERLGDATFLILRARDHSAPDDAGTVQELTRKLAIFQRGDLLISFHRFDLSEFQAVRERFGGVASGEATSTAVLVALINATLDSFDKPLRQTERTLAAFEDGVFDDDIPAPTLRDAHYLKRRVSLSRRILWQTVQVLQKLVPPAERAEPLFQDLRESADAYLFWTEQLVDEVNQLLQIHLGVSSHRTNEVMRVLTIFSVFFLPLTFIAGIYGMNFAHMPELGSPYGYPVALGAMLLLGIGIFTWFKRRGWL
jgi:magnesium transporter